MKSKFLPCPFCGGTWIEVLPQPSDGYLIKCETCGAKKLVFARYDVAEQLESAWNRRAPVTHACSLCGGPTVTEWQDQTFEYGAGPDAMKVVARVPVRQCAPCDFAFTDYEAEGIRMDAIITHLGKKLYSLENAKQQG